LEKENKAIASQAALEKQERELKASWERTRSEREQLEEENKMLRRQLTE
jgi:histidinol-phosphate/aromatic aminotransferase/cobyric acid decarboxylase-like protein